MPTYVAFGYMYYDRKTTDGTTGKGWEYKHVEFEAYGHETAKTIMDVMGIVDFKGPNYLKRRLFVEVE